MYELFLKLSPFINIALIAVVIWFWIFWRQAERRTVGLWNRLQQQQAGFNRTIHSLQQVTKQQGLALTWYANVDHWRNPQPRAHSLAFETKAMSPGRPCMAIPSNKQSATCSRNRHCHRRKKQASRLRTRLTSRPPLANQCLRRQRYQMTRKRPDTMTDKRLIEAQRNALAEVLQEAVALYGKPGGPWNVPNDPGGWLARAQAALSGLDSHKASAAPTDHRLVRQVLWGISREKRKRTEPMWARVKKVFLVGRTTAQSICRSHGFDPDSGQEISA